MDKAVSTGSFNDGSAGVTAGVSAKKKKRDDTPVGAFRKTYGQSFASGYSDDTRISTVFKVEKVNSIEELMAKKRH